MVRFHRSTEVSMLLHHHCTQHPAHCMRQHVVTGSCSCGLGNDDHRSFRQAAAWNRSASSSSVLCLTHKSLNSSVVHCLKCHTCVACSYRKASVYGLNNGQKRLGGALYNELYNDVSSALFHKGSLVQVGNLLRNIEDGDENDDDDDGCDEEEEGTPVSMSVWWSAAGTIKVRLICGSGQLQHSSAMMSSGVIAMLVLRLSVLSRHAGHIVNYHWHAWLSSTCHLVCRRVCQLCLPASMAAANTKYARLMRTKEAYCDTEIPCITGFTLTSCSWVSMSSVPRWTSTCHLMVTPTWSGHN